MTKLNESKIKGLIRLIERGRIEIDGIKNEDYKAEVKDRLDDEE